MSRSVLIALGALAIVCGTYLSWSAHRAHPSLARTAVESTDDADIRKDGDGAPSASNASSVPATSVRARHASPRKRFEQSRDLFALVQALRAAADGGDATSQTLIADAYLECIGVAMNPASRNPGVSVAEAGHPQIKLHVDGLLAVHQERCGRFEKQDIGGLQNVVALYANAAKNGSAKALAMQLVYSPNLDAIPDAELATDVEQIENSGDPEAIKALSNLMGLRAEGRESVFGASSGTEVDGYAWLLAACDMGMDCGADSALVRGYCLNGGLCEANSVDQIVSSYKLSPADYLAAVAISRQIESSLVGRR